MKRESQDEILILVTLYEKSIFESKTLCSLFSGKKYFIESRYYLVVRDNGAVDQSEDFLLLLSKLGIEGRYFWDGENKPLSIVYNSVIDARYNRFQLFVNLDDDTVLNDDYFNSLLNLTGMPGFSIAIPKVIVGKCMVSPGYYIGFKGFGKKRIRNGFVSSRFFMAITSGMVIEKKFLARTGLRFNERLNLYGIDTDFFLQARRRVKKIYIMSSEIKHSSALKQLSGSDLSKRMSNRYSAWRIIHSRGVFRVFVEVRIAWNKFRFRYL